MIQAIIFDVGGVLIRTQDHEPRRRLEQWLNLGYREAEEIVFSSVDGTAAQQGEISDVELWQRIARQFDLEPEELDEFRRGFWAGDVLDQEMVDLIRRLHMTYQTAIISNATDNLRRLLTEEHQIADAFDLIVCSAEENVMKPHPEIYRRTLSRLGRKPQETIFVDDSPTNVSAARQLGMHAVHYREGIDLPVVLSRLGVQIDSEPDKKQSKHELSGGQPHD